MTEQPLQIVILAGGLGTRVSSVSNSVPKSMLDINGRPFIAYQLQMLQRNGIKRVLICAGHLGEKIQSFVGDGSSLGMDIEFSFDGTNLLGTAGAIRRALPGIAENFFVTYGDSYLRCDYSAIQSVFFRSEKSALMTVYKNSGKWDKSNVEFVNHQVVAYDKKKGNPRMCHIDYGLGLFKRQAFERIKHEEAFDLATLYQQLLGEGELEAYEVTERFYEIGSPEGLEETRRYLALQSEV